MVVNPIEVKYHSLTGRITPKLVHQAFRNVKRNRGAAGIDKQSIQMFEANLEQNLDALLRDLKTRGKFSPKPLRRVYIAKGKGKFRPLGIPTFHSNCTHPQTPFGMGGNHSPLSSASWSAFRSAENP